MIEHAAVQPRMVAVQLSTGEGAFICNVKESDLSKIDAGVDGTLIVIHCAIRLDAMIEGRYELHETKVVETSSIDFYRSLQRNTRYMVRNGQPVLCLKKGRRNG